MPCSGARSFTRRSIPLSLFPAVFSRPVFSPLALFPPGFCSLGLFPARSFYVNLPNLTGGEQTGVEKTGGEKTGGENTGHQRFVCNANLAKSEGFYVFFPPNSTRWKEYGFCIAIHCKEKHFGRAIHIAIHCKEKHFRRAIHIAIY